VHHYSPLKPTVNAASIVRLAAFVKLALYHVAVVILGSIFWRIAEAKARFETNAANKGLVK
jgi:hypothetical protein